MARRIEIELTSTRPDGSWSWRAAGARQPKGVLDGGLLHEGAKAGDVLRADAEFEIDGIVITAVLPPKEKKREEPQRIEVIGPAGGDAPGVTTQLVGRGGRGRPGERRDRDGRPGERRDRDGRPGRSQGAPGERAGGAGGREAGDRRRGEGRPDAAARGGARPEGAERRPTRDAGASRQPSGPRRDGPARPADGGRSRGRRLSPGHAHRHEVMASLPPEEQAVAEQVLRGGIPAVRTAIHLEREKAEAEGRPVPDADALLALAEQLLPRLKTAEWHDRAEAALKAGSEIALRDLRSVVAGADAARDEQTRALAGELRAALDARVEGLRTEWVNDLTRHLEEGRVVRALQLAGRPPDPQTRLPAELADRAAQAASAALNPETPPDRWMALMEAVAASPLRREVTPVGLPAEPGPDLLRAAQQQSGRIPALASMLGVSIPPPPGPRAGSAPRKPGGRAPRRPVPAPGSAAHPEAAAPEAAAPETPASETPAPEAPAPETRAAEPELETPAAEPEPQAAESTLGAAGADAGND